MKWIEKRLTERTTWDGVVLVVSGLTILLAPTNLIGLGYIIYGAWTIWKAE